MKIAGTAALTASPQQVFDAFHDPQVLARCLPGCESLTEVGPHQYAMTVTAGVAAIKGRYDGTVCLRDPHPPEGFTLKASGAGGPGTVDADVVVRLAPGPAGGTALTYDADATVGGVLGGVGQRMLAGVTRKMAAQFFAAVDADIAGVRVGPAAVPTPARGTVGEVPGGARPIEPVGTSTPPYAARRDLGLALVAGGAIALAGVIVGWAIGGR